MLSVWLNLFTWSCHLLSQCHVAQLKQYDWITVFRVVLFARLSLILKNLSFHLNASAPANSDSVKKLQTSHLLTAWL